MKINSKLVKSENIKVYASEAKLYDELHPELWNWYEQKLYQKLVDKTLKIIKGKKNPVIVDVGAGTGNLTLKYLEAGCRVISVDISKEMLQVLEAKLTKAQKKKCTIINADIESVLPKIGQIDGVCFSGVLHHLYDYVSQIGLSARNPHYCRYCHPSPQLPVEWRLDRDKFRSFQS